MSIFKSYTGNAMLNNALMTIEVLADLNDVTEISIDVIKRLFVDLELTKMNKRFKSYTMLFTRNGPLHNDKKLGEKIYSTLIENILSVDNNTGDKVCELSGLKFSKSFEEIYYDTLKELKIEEKEIKKKDLTIGRTWFPLIGGLGSDAQALPLAKYAIQIHPICIVVMQFLPFSGVLYKGGIMLADSSNFKFAKYLVQKNVSEVRSKIERTSKSEQIENIKENNKGDFIRKAIEYFTEKIDFYEDTFTDLNLWSFSNSGTGASCFIDRVPNQLLLKLIEIQKEPLLVSELTSILRNPKIAESFLESLEGNQMWYGLFPYKFGTGAKAVEFDGVSIHFMEKYIEQTKQKVNLPLIKHIATLIDKYKDKNLTKIVEKKDGYNDDNFTFDIYKVLVMATGEGDFNPLHFIELLPNELPVSPYFNKYNKLIHFYCYKNEKLDYNLELPKNLEKNKVYQALLWINSIIHSDDRVERIKKDLIDPQQFGYVNYIDLFLRYSKKHKNILEQIMAVFYNESPYFARKGLNQLLRLYYSWDLHSKDATPQPIETTFRLPGFIKNIEQFAQDYHAYYMDKYEDKETKELPIAKYEKQIDAIQLYPTDNLLIWINDVLGKMEKSEVVKKKWSEDEFLYDDDGNFATQWVKFILKYQLQNQ